MAQRQQPEIHAGRVSGIEGETRFRVLEREIPLAKAGVDLRQQCPVQHAFRLEDPATLGLWQGIPVPMTIRQQDAHHPACERVGRIDPYRRFRHFEGFRTLHEVLQTSRAKSMKVRIIRIRCNRHPQKPLGFPVATIRQQIGQPDFLLKLVHDHPPRLFLRPIGYCGMPGV